MARVDDIKNSLRRRETLRTARQHDTAARAYLSTGSTLLNLAFSGKRDGGLLSGKYYNLVGDSGSGKTFLALTCFAESRKTKAFARYRLIYDNGEDGALMDIERFFGAKVSKDMEPPAGDRDEPEYSYTVENFYDNLNRALKLAREEDRPFIYVLDSESVLTSGVEQEKGERERKARLKGVSEPGSYGDGKAKLHSSNLRRVINPLKVTNSILIMISQTRDNIGAFSFEDQVRPGGRALKFLACVECWGKVKRRITKEVMGKRRTIGIVMSVKVKKNRLTGYEGTVSIPIYRSFGIDDVGSCVDFLIESGPWSKSGRKVKSSYNFEGTKEGLIEFIEREGLEDDLMTTVGEVWEKIEAAIAVKRKKRYE